MEWKPCRICLSQCSESLSIFEIYGNEYLPDIIHTLTQIVVTEDDELPSTICYNCADQLYLAEYMRKLCISSDKYLKEQKLNKEEKISEESVNKEKIIIESVPECNEIDSIKPDEEQNVIMTEEHLDLEEYFLEPYSKEDSSTIKEIPEETVECRSETPIIVDDGTPVIPELYICIICSYKYTSLNEFNKHQKYHYSINVRCPICLEEIASELMKLHILSHNEKLELTCPQCNLNCFDLVNLFKHIIEAHRKENIPKETSAAKLYKPYVFRCGYCDYETASKASWRNHMQRSHSITDRYCYKCYYCTRQFVVRSNLLHHYDNCHNPLGIASTRKFACTLCDKKFYLKAYLINHMRCHTGERPYKCEYCNKTFKQSGTLKMHQRVHNDEKVHLCSTCGKGFKFLGHFVYHQNIHLDKRPYVCNICNRAFRAKDSLKVHKKIHGEKNFCCHLCESKFTMNCLLNKHLRNKHNIFPNKNVIETPNEIEIDVV